MYSELVGIIIGITVGGAILITVDIIGRKLRKRR